MTHFTFTHFLTKRLSSSGGPGPQLAPPSTRTRTLSSPLQNMFSRRLSLTLLLTGSQLALGDK